MKNIKKILLLSALSLPVPLMAYAQSKDTNETSSVQGERAENNTAAVITNDTLNEKKPSKSGSSSKNSDKDKKKEKKEPEVILNPNGLSPELLSVVNKGIKAVTRQADDQDANEANRIRRKGRDVIVTALATRGYFSPDVTLEVEQDSMGEIWNVSIDPGKKSHIKSVNNKFTGAVTGPAFDERRAKILKDWGLPEGKPFLNSDWSSAKSKLLGALTSEDFYLARMTESRAEVDPEASTVDLMTDADSGPAVKLGHTEIVGLRRVPVSLIRRYVRYKPGAPYSEKELEDWQQSLLSTNFFRGVFVNLRKPEGSEVYTKEEASLPVLVRVTEAPARTFQGNIGIDSVNKVLVEGTYRQNIVNDWPITLETGASLGFKEQRGYLDFYLPPNKDGSVDRFGVVARHSDYSEEEISRFALGWRRNKEFKLDEASRVDYETLWSLVAAMDKVNRKDGPKYTLPSVVASWSILRRDVNDKFDPRDGNLQMLDLGVGMDVRNKDPFARIGLRSQIWWPVGKRDNFSLRGEIGYVKASDDTRFPDDFGYRVGGARTVRGYRYLDIGRESGDAVVGARAMYAGSAEYTHYFNNFLGMAGFVDVGDAGENFGQLRPVVGYGVGGRVKTPAGPLFLDVAYGQHDHSFRLHFSMGIAF